MPRCLVSVPHIGAARTYVLEDATLSALKQAINVCPVLGGKVDLTASSFQILDKTFEEYIDVSPEDTIPDLSKIQVRPQMDSDRHCASTSTEHVTGDSTVACGRPSHENNSFVSFDMLSLSEDHGHNFVFPNLGTLHESITAGGHISSAVFRKIVDMLFSEMRKITLFPSRHFYSRVTSLLLEKYPQLKDALGTGADSWKVALRYRFKNLRRGLPNDGRVGDNRIKFASRRKGSEETAAAELQRHKVLKLVRGIPH
ncbi:hypothetical protein MRX96_056836 [Rhipicephalus microplus]